MSGSDLTALGAVHARSVATKAILIFVGVALFLGFLSLGYWQLQRRVWKLALIERVTERLHAQPSAAPVRAQWPQITAAHYEYLPVTVTGEFLYDKTVLSQAATELGMGFWVMTPLQTADGSQILVNRGFIPASERQAWLPISAAGATRAVAPADQTAAAHADAQHITGLLRISEVGGGFLRKNDPANQRWHSRDVAAIAKAQGLAQAAPYFIDQGLPHQSKNQNTWPRQGMTVIVFHNSHMVYALTWFGMALLVLVGAYVFVRFEKRSAPV